MSVGVGYLAAFGGGVVSFASPCVLPLVPAYLSMVTGLDVAEVQDGASHQLARILRDTALFVAGFGAVFVTLGLSATALGRAAFRNHLLLTRVSGAAVVVMAAFMAGSLVLRLPWLYREARFHPSPSRLGPLAAPLTGAAFGFGWTPCIGPILASVLAVAAGRGSAAQGAGLLAMYSLGLAVPFLGAGLAFGRLAGAFGWVKRHFAHITLTASVVMAGFGILLMLDRLTWVTTELEVGLRHIGLGGLVNLG